MTTGETRSGDAADSNERRQERMAERADSNYTTEGVPEAGPGDGASEPGVSMGTPRREGELPPADAGDGSIESSEASESEAARGGIIAPHDHQAVESHDTGRPS